LLQSLLITLSLKSHFLFRLVSRSRNLLPLELFKQTITFVQVVFSSLIAQMYSSLLIVAFFSNCIRVCRKEMATLPAHIIGEGPENPQTTATTKQFLQKTAATPASALTPNVVRGSAVRRPALQLHNAVQNQQQPSHYNGSNNMATKPTTPHVERQLHAHASSSQENNATPGQHHRHFSASATAVGGGNNAAAAATESHSALDNVTTRKKKFGLKQTNLGGLLNRSDGEQNDNPALLTPQHVAAATPASTARTSIDGSLSTAPTSVKAEALDAVTVNRESAALPVVSDATPSATKRRVHFSDVQPQVNERRNSSSVQQPQRQQQQRHSMTPNDERPQPSSSSSSSSSSVVDEPQQQQPSTTAVTTTAAPTTATTNVPLLNQATSVSQSSSSTASTTATIIAPTIIPTVMNTVATTPATVVAAAIVTPAAVATSTLASTATSNAPPIKTLTPPSNDIENINKTALVPSNNSNNNNNNSNNNLNINK
jgi:hypothetical protein